MFCHAFPRKFHGHGLSRSRSTAQSSPGQRSIASFLEEGDYFVDEPDEYADVYDEDYGDEYDDEYGDEYGDEYRQDKPTTPLPYSTKVRISQTDTGKLWAFLTHEFGRGNFDFAVCFALGPLTIVMTDSSSGG
jgi:hypothetical protein